jgi:hypothetical protein
MKLPYKLLLVIHILVSVVDQCMLSWWLIVDRIGGLICGI